MTEIVYRVKAGTRDTLLGRILEGTVRMSTTQQSYRATRAVHKRAATCAAIAGGVFENPL